MSFVITIGWVIGLFCFAIGCIMYFSGWEKHRAFRLIFGGIILFAFFLWLDMGIWIGPGGEGLNETQTQSPSPTP